MEIKTLTCSPGTPPTGTSPPASSASRPEPPRCSWGHTTATQPQQVLTDKY